MAARYRLDIRGVSFRDGYVCKYEPVYHSWWVLAWLDGMFTCWTEDHAVGFSIKPVEDANHG